MEPLVSVNCLTYNHAPFIRECLDGFIIQKTNFPFEVLLHDDASTDGTQDIIREYERDFPDIFKAIYQKENQYSKGIKASRIYQLPRAKGKYMASCEGDDYWIDPNKLQMQVDYMEKNPECVCTFHAAAWVKNIMGKVRVVKINQPWFQETNLCDDFMVRAGGAFFDTLSLVSRMDIAKKFPKFRTTANVGDYPFVCLLASEGYFHYFPNVMGAYRVCSSGSWNEKFSKDMDFAIKHYLNALNWLYEYNLYIDGKFSVGVGKMMYNYVQQLEEFGVIKNYPKLFSVYEQIEEKSKKMKKLELVLKVINDKTKVEKYRAAEKEYYDWFVSAIGDFVKTY